MSFTADEKVGLLEPGLGLDVDPGSVTASMEAVNPAAARQDMSDVPEALQADATKFGKEVTMAAYARGWRPQAEHQGNPDSWVGPVEYFDTYAERVDGRVDKIVEGKLQGIEGVVERRLKKLAGRVDRIDATDREATDAHYAALIAQAGKDSPAEIPKLMKARDEALAEIDSAKADPAGIEPSGIDTTAETFFSKHKAIANPKTPDDFSLKGWALGRSKELETKYPKATSEEIFRQLDAELEARDKSTTGRTLIDGGNTPAGQGGGNTDVITPATMTGEHKEAFGRLVNLGAYKEDQVAEYVKDLNEELGYA